MENSIQILQQKLNVGVRGRAVEQQEKIDVVESSKGF
jgi:hypothetical protein